MKESSPVMKERVLEVWVQPRASRNEIIGYRNHFLRLRVTAPPVEGEANQSVKRLLAEALGIPPSRVEILKGDKGRRKKVRVLEVPLSNCEKLENMKEEPEISYNPCNPETSSGRVPGGNWPELPYPKDLPPADEAFTVSFFVVDRRAG